jgi:hypothetical protein
MTTLSLQDLLDTETQTAFPLLIEMPVTEEPPPKALENLTKLGKLGILNADTLMALVAQAPIDPVNLAGTLMRLMPDGWVFSAIDFSMIRVLAKDKRVVAAAMHVDLMGSTIKFLARNSAGQLTSYKDYDVTPGEKTWDDVQLLIRETIAAADRENAAQP